MVSPHRITLSAQDRDTLNGWVRVGATPQKLVLHAMIVLLAADDTSNAAIAEELGICVDTARKWRARFAGKGIEGLADAPRPGRPPIYAPADRAKVTAWACAARRTRPAAVAMERCGAGRPTAL